MLLNVSRLHIVLKIYSIKNKRLELRGREGGGGKRREKEAKENKTR